MDFSLKQALQVVVVIAAAALVVITVVSLTNSNNDKATENTDKMWNEASSLIQ